jgi:hypothetical protein
MRNIIVWVIVGGFLAWTYNEYRKNKNKENPKVK